MVSVLEIGVEASWKSSSLYLHKMLTLKSPFDFCVSYYITIDGDPCHHSKIPRRKTSRCHEKGRESLWLKKNGNAIQSTRSRQRTRTLIWWCQTLISVANPSAFGEIETVIVMHYRQEVRLREVCQRWVGTSSRRSPARWDDLRQPYQSDDCREAEISRLVVASVG